MSATLMSARISDKIAQLLVRGLYFHHVVKIVLIDFTAGLQSRLLCKEALAVSSVLAAAGAS